MRGVIADLDGSQKFFRPRPLSQPGQNVMRDLFPSTMVVMAVF